MILYTLRSSDGEYRITKFDHDLNPEASYLVSAEACECPAGHRPTCRHRKMLPIMLDRMDSAWMYNFDDGTWVQGPEYDFQLVEREAPQARTEPTDLDLLEANPIEREAPTYPYQSIRRRI